MNRVRVLQNAAIACLVGLASTLGQAATTFDCAFGTGNGDLLDRGFYVDNYAGNTLDTVTLLHYTNAPGARTIQLTARLTSFNGTVLGTATVTRTITNLRSKSVFQFGNVPVTAGSRITFKQAVIAGEPTVTYNTGSGPCANVTETEGTAAPLDTFRRNSVGVIITGAPANNISALIVDCPYGAPPAGDEVTHGFYVTNYGGVSLDIVRMLHATDSPGVKTIQMVARLNRFDGPVVGSASVTRSLSTAFTETQFEFLDVDVPAGSTITFTQVVTAGTARVFFDAGLGPCNDIRETSATVPPLDSVLRNSTGIKIAGRVASDFAVEVVEYFNASFQHYFVTADPDEIAGLDGGAFGGAFVRTGQSFYARNGPAYPRVDVCRFFTVAFAPKSSHFYTADAAECAYVKLNPDWQYEKVAYYVRVPVAGVCPAFTVPVYRLYNNGQTGAPNHRTTTSLAIYNDFIANRGWAGEGIRFCGEVLS